MLCNNCCCMDEAGGGGDRVEPEEQVETRNGKAEEFDGPVKKRSCTDVTFLFILVAFLIVLVVLVGRCFAYGDILRIVNGYDNCGNICGIKNQAEKDPRLSCKGKDMTENRYLLVSQASKAVLNVRHVYRECVPNCQVRKNYRKFLNRCVPNKTDEVVDNFLSKTGIKNFFQEVSEDLNLCWREMLYLCLIALGLSVGALILFRYCVGYVIWFFLLTTVATSILGSVFLWVRWYHKKHDGKKLLISGYNGDSIQSSPTVQQSDIDERKETMLFVYAIVATIATVVISLVVLVMRKRIKLVVQLFREAGKAITSMPLLLLQPIITFLALAIVVALWLYCSLWIESSGVLTPDSQPNFTPLAQTSYTTDSQSTYFYYKKDIAMKVTRWYNLMALFWITQFFIGCQDMVIAGSVATWFFTRKKDELQSPIRTSAWNLVRYHLGSVAMGSFLIAVVQMIRAILQWLQTRLKGTENSIAKCINSACMYCLKCFEMFIKFLTRNAYVEVAMFGHSFCRAGREAFSMLCLHPMHLLAINSVGDFVLFLGKALVVMATVLIGVEMLETKENVHHMWVPLGLAGLFAYLVAHCFITVYEMVIDTIFLCFCEDMRLNDGVDKPYYMNHELMEFVNDSKKALKLKDV